MNRHFTSTRFIQYSYFNAISKLAPAIYQNNIYILYKCIIPNYIVGSGMYSREKYPEEDAFLELRGEEDEEKERICEIKPIIITAVSFL